MHTVDNPVEKVFKRWSSAVGSFIGEDNCSMQSSSTVANTPFARMLMIGNPTSRFDLAGDEVSTTLSFSVESYASGTYGITDAYAIDEVSHQSMIDMGFRRSYGPQLVDNADMSIKRVISRYTRSYTGLLLNE